VCIPVFAQVYGNALMDDQAILTAIKALCAVLAVSPDRIDNDSRNPLFLC
jgi:hypothetical protein